MIFSFTDVENIWLSLSDLSTIKSDRVRFVLLYEQLTNDSSQIKICKAKNKRKAYEQNEKDKKGQSKKS